MNSKTVMVLFFLGIYSFAWTQIFKDSIASVVNKKYQFNYKQIIVPAALFGYGIFGLENHQIQLFNSGISEEVNEHIDEKISIDDFSQYLPVASVYGLSVLGVQGKHNFKDKTIIVATSYLIMGLAVNTFKLTSTVERPDKTSLNSFPSGHTATAFMGAELLYQEYKDVSVWYGISGYLIATGTGVFRMYNNRHWLSDVVAGAGVGILSAKAGYWLYPVASKIFNKKNNKNKTVFVPFYDGNTAGFGLVSKF